MTQNEIKLVLFITIALVVGALFQDWRHKHPIPPPTPTPVPSKKWAKPPYVFKNLKELNQAAENVKAEDHAYAPKRKEMTNAE